MFSWLIKCQCRVILLLRQIKWNEKQPFPLSALMCVCCAWRPEEWGQWPTALRTTTREVWISLHTYMTYTISTVLFCYIETTQIPVLPKVYESCPAGLSNMNSSGYTHCYTKPLCASLCFLYINSICRNNNNHEHHWLQAVREPTNLAYFIGDFVFVISTQNHLCGCKH